MWPTRRAPNLHGGAWCHGDKAGTNEVQFIWGVFGVMGDRLRVKVRVLRQARKDARQEDHQKSRETVNRA